MTTDERRFDIGADINRADRADTEMAVRERLCQAAVPDVRPKTARAALAV
jgi:hypothetical protein